MNKTDQLPFPLQSEVDAISEPMTNITPGDRDK